MDATTELALRAIVRGLHVGRAIDDAQIMAIMASLRDAAEQERSRDRALHEGEMLRLSRGIARDASIDE